MLRPEEFLEQQFKDLEDGIGEALRHEYGPAESEDFFAECQLRLAGLRAYYNDAPSEFDSRKIQTLTNECSHLAELINRIQRSHLGEFPWAFAEELKALAIALCADKSSPTQKRPLFFFSSEGPLDSYCVHPEQVAGPDLYSTPIFNIDFPRSHKHQVLLHPVLAHEIGHAYSTFPAKVEVEREVRDTLIKDSPLENRKSFAKWLKEHCSVYYPKTPPKKRLDAMMQYWAEEFFCDLFGLMVIGPSFTPALLSLIGAFDPVGDEPGSMHPPINNRAHMQYIAVQELKWLQLTGRPAQMARDATSKLWASVSLQTRRRAAASLLRPKQIREATQVLASHLGVNPECTFDSANLSAIDTLFRQILNLVPPVGKQDLNDDFPSVRTDFRAILYSGWIATSHNQTSPTNGLNVENISRLCEHAIMQQRALIPTVPRKG